MHCTPCQAGSGQGHARDVGLLTLAFTPEAHNSKRDIDKIQFISQHKQANISKLHPRRLCIPLHGSTLSHSRTQPPPSKPHDARVSSSTHNNESYIRPRSTHPFNNNTKHSKLHGAAEARRAHNPEVTRSKRVAAKVLIF